MKWPFLFTFVLHPRGGMSFLDHSICLQDLLPADQSNQIWPPWTMQQAAMDVSFVSKTSQQ